LPNKIGQQIAEISKCGAIKFVSCYSEFISDRLNAPPLVNSGWPPVTGAEAWKALLAYSFVTSSSILARRDDVMAAGMFDPDACPAEDQDLWIKLARRGKVGFVPEVLVRYYDTAGSEAKRRPAVGRITTLKVIERHIAEAGDLLSDRERRQIRACRYERLGRA